ncbi:MAG: periplasmic heavy metal sensor [Endomicrobiaceae bacterium]|nr:periplasmic heavy metal sensor [Endomicrobiaceae bacterium]
MNKNEKGQSCKMCQKREKMADKMMEDLKVTPEQKTKLETLRKNHEEKINMFRTQMKEKRDAMRTELTKENYDMTVIEGLKNDIKEIGGSMTAERANMPIEMRKLLTAEQFTKLEAKRPKMKKMKKMKGDMHPPMPMEE